MAFSNPEGKLYYYYWWSDMGFQAFPNMKFKITLKEREINTLGYTTNYYLDEIKWPDKRVVGISETNPMELYKQNKQNKEATEMDKLFTGINIR